MNFGTTLPLHKFSSPICILLIYVFIIFINDFEVCNKENLCNYIPFFYYVYPIIR